MPRISISNYELNNLIKEGTDLKSYFKGRFEEAFSRGDLPQPTILYTKKADSFTDEAKLYSLEAKVETFTNDIADLRSDNVAIFERLCELENAMAKSATGASGRVYRVGDSVTIKGMGLGKIVEVDPLDEQAPVRVAFEDEGLGLQWVNDVYFEGSF